MANEQDEDNSDADFTLANESDPDIELAEANDDFTLAKEPPQDASSSAMRQSDQGLLFEPSESSECYELQAPDAPWNGDSTANASSSSGANAGRMIEPPQDDGIYGLQTPSLTETVGIGSSGVAPSPSSAPRSVKSAPSKKNGKKWKSRSESAPSDADAGFSLDALYARRFTKRSEDDPSDQRAKRPDLPEKPLADRIFTPFLTYGFALRFGIVALFTAFLMTPCLYLLAHMTSHDIADAITSDAKLGAFFAFFKCIWNDKFLLLLFSLIWTLLAAPHYFQLWLETASGSDEVDDWGGYDFVASAASFLWLLFILTLAGIPGAALFGLVGFSSWAGLVISSAILTPFCLLSCIQSGGYFTVFSKDVALSVKSRSKLWLIITCATIVVFLALLALGIAALYRTVVFDKDASVSWLTAFGASLVFAIISNLAAAFYLRMLGRVAWVVDEDARARREEEAESEERAANEQFDEYKDRVAAEDEARNS